MNFLRKRHTIQIGITIVFVAVHVGIQYYLKSIIANIGFENIVKATVLLINSVLYCFMVWLWTKSIYKTIFFFCMLFLVLALSFVGYYLESNGISKGFVLSVLRARLIDAPLLLGIYLIVEKTKIIVEDKK